MALEDIGVVLHCGGWGTRLGIYGPKSLYPLPGGETTLSLILQDLPEELRVYIHTLNEQKEMFESYIRHEFPGRKNIEIILQRTTPLLDKGGQVMINKEGREIRVSDGHATFANSIRSPPGYFFIMDGCQFGVDFHEVEEAFEQLKNCKKDAMVFARRLNNDEIERDMVALLQCRTRPVYTRVDMRTGKIAEYPNITLGEISNGENLGMTSHHLVKADRYIHEMRRTEAPLVKVDRAEGYYSGFARQLRTPHIYARGLTFGVYESHTDKVGLKERGDIERWRDKNPAKNRNNPWGTIRFDFEPPMLSNRMEDYCW